MKELKRRNIYKNTYEEVIVWAKEQHKKYDVRAPNNTPLNNSFPCSLEKYLEHLKKRRMLKCRICPHCKRIMIQTMCLQGCELVCVPCQYGVGMFNDEQEVYVPYDIHEKLCKKYEKDIHKMAFELGGAGCCKCNKIGGNNCKICNTDYDYEFKDLEVNQ